MNYVNDIGNKEGILHILSSVKRVVSTPKDRLLGNPSAVVASLIEQARTNQYLVLEALENKWPIARYYDAVVIFMFMVGLYEYRRNPEIYSMKIPLFAFMEGFDKGNEKSDASLYNKLLKKEIIKTFDVLGIQNNEYRDMVLSASDVSEIRVLANRVNKLKQCIVKDIPVKIKKARKQIMEDAKKNVAFSSSSATKNGIDYVEKIDDESKWNTIKNNKTAIDENDLFEMIKRVKDPEEKKKMLLLLEEKLNKK